jgi:hypothetical protein
MFSQFLAQNGFDLDQLVDTHLTRHRHPYSDQDLLVVSTKRSGVDRWTRRSCEAAETSGKRRTATCQVYWNNGGS